MEQHQADQDQDLEAGSAPDAASTAETEVSSADQYVEQVRRTNAQIPGQLMLHYRSRDVSVAVDGASAMRIISTWQQRPSRLPRVDPQWSSAKWPWLGIDLDELVGMLWIPDDEFGAGGNPERVTVDPHT